MIEKLYYKIGEISKIIDVESSVLRFWEQEFKKIQPSRTESGQRLYSKKDLEMILKIKNLLYDKKFTIEGARKHLSLKSEDIKKDILYEVKDDLLKILESLK